MNELRDQYLKDLIEKRDQLKKSPRALIGAGVGALGGLGLLPTYSNAMSADNIKLIQEQFSDMPELAKQMMKNVKHKPGLAKFVLPAVGAIGGAGVAKLHKNIQLGRLNRQIEDLEKAAGLISGTSRLLQGGKNLISRAVKSTAEAGGALRKNISQQWQKGKAQANAANFRALSPDKRKELMTQKIQQNKAKVTQPQPQTPVNANPQMSSQQFNQNMANAPKPRHTQTGPKPRTKSGKAQRRYYEQQSSARAAKRVAQGGHVGAPEPSMFGKLKGWYSKQSLPMKAAIPAVGGLAAGTGIGMAVGGGNQQPQY